MSTQGKIKTLFSDKEKTEALFPRTKINAVSDENGKGLNAILDDMAYVGDITEDVASTPVNADLLGGRPAGEYATQNYVANEIAKAQLEGEDVDLSGYATKDEMNAAIRAIDFPVDSVNGRTGAITLNASDVGAHPNTWLPTIAEIGSAPAGYGLGGEAKQISSWDDAIQTGFYMSPTGPLNGPWFYGFVIRKTDKILIQKVWTNDEQTSQFGCGFYSAERRKLGSTWGEWEWVNPPMKLGVEYRTTERWNGKPVYVALVDLGNMPDGQTYKDVEFLVSGGQPRPFFVIGLNSVGCTLPAHYADGNSQYISAERNDLHDGVRIRLKNGVAGWTAVALVKYILE